MGPKTEWKRILVHDLRRTLESWQAATDANNFVIGHALGHKNVQSTAVYAQLNLDPIRDSIEKGTQAMLETVKKDKE